DGAKIEETAAERNLDAKRLHAWVDRIKTVGAPALAGLPNPAQAGTPTQTSDNVVIDYAAARPDDWMPDDVSFGPAPVRVGELRFDGSADKPAVRFAERAAAEKDPAWAGLSPTPDSQTDHGALGGWVRPGRT